MGPEGTRAELEAWVEALDDTRVARVEQVLVHDGYATEDVEVTHAAVAFAALDVAGPASFPVLLERLRTTARASLRRAILHRLGVRRLSAGEHAARVEAELRAWITRAPIDEVPAVVAALYDTDVRRELLARVAREATPSGRLHLLRAVPRSFQRPMSLTDEEARLLVEGTLAEARALAPLAPAERVRALLADPATRERGIEIFSVLAERTREALMSDFLDLTDDPRFGATVLARLGEYPIDSPSTRRLRATRGDVSWAETLGGYGVAQAMREVLEAIADPLVPDGARLLLIATAGRRRETLSVGRLTKEQCGLVIRAATTWPAIVERLLGALTDGALEQLDHLGPLAAMSRDPASAAELRRVLGSARASALLGPGG